MRSRLKLDLLQVLNEQKEAIVGFNYLLESLATPIAKYKGAAIRIPEAIIFNCGRPKCLLYYNEATNEVKKIDDKSKMNNSNLMKIMISRYRIRRTGRIIIKAKVNRKLRSEINVTKDQSLAGTMISIRREEEDECMYMTQLEFVRMMMERPGSELWHNVNLIQNYIVISNLMPEVFHYVYTAPINLQDPKAKISYPYLFSTTNDKNEQAYGICSLIGRYMAKMRGIVISVKELGNSVYEGYFS